MKKLYNFSITVLAVTSIVFVILDLCNVISLSTEPYYIIDTTILLVFTTDYAVRLYASKDRNKFFKENIFDLVAIIPFNSIFAAFRIFRVVRILRLTKLAKLSRVVRAAAFFGIIKAKLSGILRTNGFLYVLYANMVMILLSSSIMMFAENMTFPNALWWSIVTCTTVGYGDISPSTGIGKIIAVLLMLFGIGMIGMLTGAITTYFSTRQTAQDVSSKELDDLISEMDDDQKQKMLEIARIIMR